MSGTSEVLQEYLVKLGFKVDQGELKKFQDSVGVVGKRVMGVGLAVAGVVAGVEAAAAAFAYSMRKVYFDSQLANSSVKNLQSLEYAGKQIGVSAEAMGGAIHSMAQAFRLNPGMKGLVESFGVKVEGRDVSDVMIDYVRALNQMPEFQASQFAAMFGMDPDTYHQMRNNMDELLAKQTQMKDVYKSLGLDMDQTAKTANHYASELDNVKMHFGALENSIMSAVLPAFDKFTGSVVKNMDVVTKWLNMPVRESAWGALMIAMGFKDANSNGRVTLTKEANARLAAMGVAQHAATPGAAAGGVAGRVAGVSGTGSTALRLPGGGPNARAAGGAKGDAATLKALEQQYGLPDGMLSRVYQIESASGKNPGLSSAGALGPFQFMKDTGSDYGLKTDADRMDFGKSSNAAAKYLSTLLKRYGGNVDMALAGYNWGIGNVDKHGMGGLPGETRGYLGQYHALEGKQVVVQNTFHITGSNANEIADKVAGAQDRTYGDALRNGMGVVR